MAPLSIQIYVVGPVQTNCYFAINDDTKEVLIIDPGASAKQLAEKVKEQEPKARYFDNLVDSKLLTTFRDTAKEFHISPKELTQWLTDNGYIYRDRHKIIKPYEQHRKSGLFQMKDFSTPYGYSNVQTYITVKGKETFRLLMESQGIIRQ